MTKSLKKETVYNIILVILTLGAVLANIKNVLVNYNVDTEYAVALSYRLVRGDSMFTQMWEAHQTSAFLAAFFIQIYLWLFGTTTGVVVFLNFVGTGIKALITLFLYRTLRGQVDKKVLYLVCLFFFTVNPKNVHLPDFSNMQLWFSVLLFGMLLRFFQNQKQKRWLLLGALALCLEVLSYPSCVIVYIGAAVLLWVYSEEKWKDLFIFSGGCFGTGLLYVGYFVLQIGFDGLFEGVMNIVSSDSFHANSPLEQWVEYLAEFGQVVLLLAECGLIAFGISRLIARVKRGKSEVAEPKRYYMFLFLVILCGYHFFSTVSVGDKYMYLSLFIAIMLCGLWSLKACEQKEKMVYITGATLSVCALLATLLLTNLSFLSSVAYLVLGVAVSFVPICKYLEEKGPVFKKIWPRAVIVLFCAVTVFRSGYLIQATHNRNNSVFDLLEAPKIVQYGPSKGVVTDYFGGHVINETYLEWPEYVKPGDRILLVGVELLSTIAYLNEDTEISAASTICTPTYDEKLLEYWEENPEKYPNVVVVSCWDGELKISEDTWIMQWIANEFQPDEVNDGAYWRYYRKE